MTGWWGIYSSKDKKDMLWPDMIWVYVLAYDIWNFQYTYLNLPTHSWYCGLALLLAPTLQQHSGIKAVGFRTVQTHWLSGACSHRYSRCSRMQAVLQQSLPYTDRAAPQQQWEAVCRLSQNRPHRNYFRTVICSECIRLRIHPETCKSTEKNPWKNEIFTDTKDYKEAMERA